MTSRYANRVTALRVALIMASMAAALGPAGCGPGSTSNAGHPGRVTASGSASAAAPSAAPSESSVPAATLQLNGTYSWTLTKEDALAHGTAGDKTPEGLANYPNTVTVRLHGDQWLWNGTDQYSAHGTYSVDGDKLAFDWPHEGYVITVGFSVDSNGNLHLKPIGPMVEGDEFVWTTETWTKIG